MKDKKRHNDESYRMDLAELLRGTIDSSFVFRMNIRCMKFVIGVFTFIIVILGILSRF